MSKKNVTLVHKQGRQFDVEANISVVLQRAHANGITIQGTIFPCLRSVCGSDVQHESHFATAKVIFRAKETSR